MRNIVILGTWALCVFAGSDFILGNCKARLFDNSPIDCNLGGSTCTSSLEVTVNGCHNSGCKVLIDSSWQCMYGTPASLLISCSSGAYYPTTWAQNDYQWNLTSLGAECACPLNNGTQDMFVLHELGGGQSQGNCNISDHPSGWKLKCDKPCPPGP